MSPLQGSGFDTLAVPGLTPVVCLGYRKVGPSGRAMWPHPLASGQRIESGKRPAQAGRTPRLFLHPRNPGRGPARHRLPDDLVSSDPLRTPLPAPAVMEEPVSGEAVRVRVDRDGLAHHLVDAA